MNPVSFGTSQIQAQKTQSAGASQHTGQPVRFGHNHDVDPPKDAFETSAAEAPEEGQPGDNEAPANQAGFLKRAAKFVFKILTLPIWLPLKAIKAVLDKVKNRGAETPQDTEKPADSPGAEGPEGADACCDTEGECETACETGCEDECGCDDTEAGPETGAPDQPTDVNHGEDSVQPAKPSADAQELTDAEVKDLISGSDTLKQKVADLRTVLAELDKKGEEEFHDPTDQHDSQVRAIKGAINAIGKEMNVSNLATRVAEYLEDQISASKKKALTLSGETVRLAEARKQAEDVRGTKFENRAAFVADLNERVAALYSNVEPIGDGHSNFTGVDSAVVEAYLADLKAAQTQQSD